jgi:hypothetical protein
MRRTVGAPVIQNMDKPAILASFGPQTQTDRSSSTRKPQTPAWKDAQC